MKNYLLALKFFFLCTLANAQSFNVAEHNGSTRTFNMVGINNKSYYLEVNTPLFQICLDNVHLIGRDDNGNEIMNKIIATDYYLGLLSPRVTVSEKQTLLIYTGTLAESCDVSGYPKFYVCEIDTLGNTLWTNTVSINVAALLPLPSGNRVMLASNTLYRLNANGQTLSTHTVNYNSTNSWNSNLNGACLLNNGNILLSYGSTFREIDTLGNDINAATINPITELNQVATGEIYGISSGNLIKLSSASYSVLATSSVSNYTANTYYYKNDSLFIVGNELNLVPKYVLLDTAFNILHQSISNLEQVVCTGITVDNTHKVKILSYGSSITNTTYPMRFSHNFSGYFHTNINGDLNGTKDIGIVRVKSSPLIYINSGYPFPKATTTITVKNFGTQPIHNFKINHYAYFQNIAPAYVGLSEFKNVVLSPGDSTSVVTGTFNAQLAYNSINQDYSICMFTTVPDSTNDYDVSNNQMCLAVTAVGIKEYSQDTKLNIFPNPSNSLLNIQAEQPINKIEIFDYSGKRAGLYTPNAPNFELKENSLASGLYIFKITTANYTVVKKVVIE